MNECLLTLLPLWLLLIAFAAALVWVIACDVLAWIVALIVGRR